MERNNHWSKSAYIKDGDKEIKLFPSAIGDTVMKGNIRYKIGWISLTIREQAETIYQFNATAKNGLTINFWLDDIGKTVFIK